MTTAVWEEAKVVAIGSRRLFRLTDTGNAERFAAMFEGRVRYCHPWGKWLVRANEGWWSLDESGQVHQLAKRCVRAIYAQASKIDDEKERISIASHATKSEARARIESLLALAQSEPGIPVMPSDLDADPYLFGCANGVLNLRTGELRNYEPEDLMVKHSSVMYDAEAQAPTWLTFINRSIPNADIRDFVQRWFGYTMLGIVQQHLLPIFYGSGANGKSTMIEAIRYVFGPYAMTAAPGLLIDSGYDSHPTDVADLFGRRLVMTSEVKAGKPFDEEQVKRLTGGDSLRARRMREDFWEFEPTHKLVMASNHKPIVRDTTESIWRRLRLIPWTEVIPEAERDADLPEKLRGEASGILRWCVNGCLAYQESGLREPDEVKVATSGYRKESDHIGEFVTDCCKMLSMATTSARAMYAAYVAWCETAGEKPQSQTGFGRAMRDRGMPSQKDGKTRFYDGIALIDDEAYEQ